MPPQVEAYLLIPRFIYDDPAPWALIAIVPNKSGAGRIRTVSALLLQVRQLHHVGERFDSINIEIRVLNLGPDPVHTRLDDLRNGQIVFSRHHPQPLVIRFRQIPNQNLLAHVIPLC
jgi:hypothetical protein